MSVGASEGPMFEGIDPDQGEWLIEHCINNVASWQFLRRARRPSLPKNVSVRPLRGGMTNAMYVLEDTSGSVVPSSHQRVVARLLAHEVDGLIDREREDEIRRIVAEAGLTPRTLGSVGKDAAGSGNPPVRFEAFVPGRTLECVDLHVGVVLHSMARRFASLHRLKVSHRTADLGDARHLQRLLRRFSSYGDPLLGKEGWDTAKMISSWLAVRDAVCGPVESWEAALCHMDAQEGNWIWEGEDGQEGKEDSDAKDDDALRLSTFRGSGMQEDAAGNVSAGAGAHALCTGLMSRSTSSSIDSSLTEVATGDSSEDVPLVLIDWEYAGVSHPAFDIGNLWCEAAIDYSCDTSPGFCLRPRWFPRLQVCRAFIRTYLQCRFGSSEKVEVDETMVEKWLSMSQVQVMGSHLLWGLWAFAMHHQRVQPSVESFDEFGFDYLAYGNTRLRLFEASMHEWDHEAGRATGKGGFGQVRDAGVPPGAQC